MDHYSDFPAPPVNEIQNNLSLKLKEYFKKDNSNFYKNIIKNEIDKMGGHSSLGSLTGYSVFTSKELLNNSIRYIEKNGFKYKISFKKILKIVYELIRIKNKIIKKRYAPYGEGYIEAKKDFEFQKLPPIGKLSLYTPIKNDKSR